MKKTLLITSGILVILIVIGVWMYLFMNGRPENTGEIFANLGISGGEEMNTNFESNSPNDIEVGEEVYEIDNTPMRLKQLTTRPVAGAGFVENGIRYVEQGTGHVYEINFEESTETLISGTTITQTVDAKFSKNGAYVALTSLTDNGSETIVGMVTNGELTGKKLPQNAKNISLEEDRAVFYTTEKVGGLSGFTHNIETNETQMVFESPLQDVVVLWGDPMYIYTTPSTGVKGYIYQIGSGSSHNYVTEGVNGLLAFRTDSKVVITTSDNSARGTYVVEEDGPQYLTTIVIPEKCVGDYILTSHIICATPTKIDMNQFPDAWYKGVISYSDSLIDIDLENGSATSLINLLNESGREVDVYKIGANNDGTKIYLVNKNDNTLWLYDRSAQ